MRFQIYILILLEEILFFGNVVTYLGEVHIAHEGSTVVQIVVTGVAFHTIVITLKCTLDRINTVLILCNISEFAKEFVEALKNDPDDKVRAVFGEHVRKLHEKCNEKKLEFAKEAHKSGKDVNYSEYVLGGGVGVGKSEKTILFLVVCPRSRSLLGLLEQIPTGRLGIE